MSDVVDLIQATVRLEQAVGHGQATLGTGFVVTSTAPDGAPRTVLITADHVFARMPRDRVSIGFRRAGPAGDWTYAPVSLRIRNAEGQPLWTRHPTQDIAAIALPAGVAPAALPAAELPGERALETLKVRPGDEMMALGYPRGVAANPAGFPILRSGRVASYPLSPSDRYPTFMVDFNVFAGNSGGPVYVTLPAPAGAPDPGARRVVVTGVLTQQIKLRDERLAIGNVTQADFISETMSLMGASEPAVVGASDSVLPASDTAEAAGGPPISARERLAEAWAAFRDDLGILVRRTWIVTRDWLLGLITPDARRR